MVAIMFHGKDYNGNMQVGITAQTYLENETK